MPDDYSREHAYRLFLNAAGFDPAKVFEHEERIEEITGAILREITQNEEAFNMAMEFETAMSDAFKEALRKHDNPGFTPMIAAAMFARGVSSAFNVGVQPIEPVDGPSKLHNVKDFSEAPDDVEPLGSVEIAAILCLLIITFASTPENTSDDG